MVLVGDHRLAVVNLSGGLALFVEGGLAVLVGVFLLVVGGGDSLVVVTALSAGQRASALVARDVITASANVSSAGVGARGGGVLSGSVGLSALISDAGADDSRTASAVAGDGGLASASASVSVALGADDMSALLAGDVSSTSASGGGLLGDSVARTIGSLDSTAAGDLSSLSAIFVAELDGSTANSVGGGGVARSDNSLTLRVSNDIDVASWSSVDGRGDSLSLIVTLVGVLRGPEGWLTVGNVDGV